MRPGLRAIQDHLKPFVLIQVCAIILVVAYYQSEVLRSGASTLAQWKAQGGLVFSALSTAFAAVVLPELFKAATRDPKRYGFRELLFNALFFGFVGILVDWFYNFQTLLFGAEVTVAVVAKKVLFDQAFFSFCISNPLGITLFQWRDLGFDTKATYQALRGNFLRQRLLPLFMVCFAYWVPLICCIYAMPLSLQFVFFLFVEAAWSLIIVHVTKGMAVTK